MGDKRYHHGSLEAALIDKGIQLLAKDGYEGFSMRKLAALCGVSHAAPYKHFKGKEEIILAISEKIAQEFGAALQQAATLHPDDSRIRVIELCVRYVQFMVEHPDYFRFVFMTAHGRPIEFSSGRLGTDGRQPLAIAWQTAEAYFRPLHGDSWSIRFMALWSMANGLTLMLVCGTVQTQGDYRELARTMFEGCV